MTPDSVRLHQTCAFDQGDPYDEDEDDDQDQDQDRSENQDHAVFYLPLALLHGSALVRLVADARDYLTDKEMRIASQWNPNDLDDEVLDRVHKVLAARVEQMVVKEGRWSGHARIMPLASPVPGVPCFALWKFHGAPHERSFARRTTVL